MCNNFHLSEKREAIYELKIYISSMISCLSSLCMWMVPYVWGQGNWEVTIQLPNACFSFQGNTCTTIDGTSCMPIKLKKQQYILYISFHPKTRKIHTCGKKRVMLTMHTKRTKIQLWWKKVQLQGGTQTQLANPSFLFIHSYWIYTVDLRKHEIMQDVFSGRQIESLSSEYQNMGYLW